MAETAEDILLLFDEDRPCWTKKALALAGQDVMSADGMCEKGFLNRKDDIYFLTPEGAARFRQAAGEIFSPLRPGLPEMSADEAFLRREAMRNFLWLLVDMRHQQRWGLKEYRKPFCFALPDLSEEEIFSLEGKKLTWRYPEHPVLRKMARDFPVVGLAARKTPPPVPKRVAAWEKENMPKTRTMEADLLYKSRYDFQAYAHFPPMPCDPCGLLNTDRFFFFFAPPPCPPSSLAWLLTVLGEFQIFLTMQRRMYLPGYVDLDSLDQDGLNWLIFVYEKEDEASACEELLAPFGDDLAGPAAPLGIWSLSLEALWAHKTKAETIHDLFPVTARRLHAA